jgi:hypothetical protein
MGPLPRGKLTRAIAQEIPSRIREFLHANVGQGSSVPPPNQRSKRSWIGVRKLRYYRPAALTVKKRRVKEMPRISLATINYSSVCRRARDPPWSS